MQAIGTLNGIGSRIANPYMIIKPLQRFEALTSSAMEGTHASPDDLVLFELDERSRVGRLDATNEVYNYIQALEDAVESTKTLPISHRLICGIHKTLLSSLGRGRGGNKLPGDYKIHQNFIGGTSIETARFIPPPPRQSLEAMDNLESYINRTDSKYPPIIDAALIHYQFECIHPFADGNGRVGRILIPLFLMTKNVLRLPLLYVSPFIEKNKDEYIDHMFAVSQSGNWIGWIRFFLQAVRASAESEGETVRQLLDLQQEYREKALSLGRSTILAQLTDSLFEGPMVTVPKAAERLKSSYPTAQKSIQKLVDLGILRELQGFSHPKLFVAQEVVRLSSGQNRHDTAPTSEPF